MAEKRALMIVESPTKVKTLKKFIDKSIDVDSSYGHIKDLPEKEFGISIVDNKFVPIFKIIPKAKKRVKNLKEESDKVDIIYLATDPDREGEAISFHLNELIGSKEKTKRIEFNEITKTAVLQALKNPRDIDINRVNAQITRRMLDRIVGYKLSPLLWKAVSAKGLSAGRVQSVALRLICDREEEIKNFKQEEYWTLDVELLDKEKNLIKAKLQKYNNKKIKIANSEEAKSIEKIIKSGKFIIKSINKRKQKRMPQPPLITSKLQQIAYNQLGFSAKKTMQIAQQLYEGVDVGRNEVVGLITYMRTDSTRISDEAFQMGTNYIAKRYGKEYIGMQPKKSNKKNIQDAHEAIRPTYITFEPESIRDNLTSDQYKLYNIIWKNFIMSIMKPAEFDVTDVYIDNNNYLFFATGQILVFDGFLKINSIDEKEENILSETLKVSDELLLKNLITKQNFTQPPLRYTEATLVKTLEEKGIGRPSTYATIVSTIQDRGYVKKDKRYFFPTLLGIEVDKIIKQYFPEIVDVKFTARMEDDLDKIENENYDWQKLLKEFYNPFIEKLDESLKKVKESKANMENKSGIKCEKCGGEMLLKLNKKGEFIACSNFPKCRNIKSITRTEDGEIKIIETQYSDKNCPKCNGRLIVKSSRGTSFLACENYPNCKYTEPIGIGISCPLENCGGQIIVRVTKRGKKFYGCSNYPNCNFISWYPPIIQKCPECGSPYLIEIKTKENVKIKCPKKECKYELIKEKEQ